MKPADFGNEMLFPLTNAGVLMSSLFLFFYLQFAVFLGVFGLILIILILPALCSYLLRILEARSRGQDPGTMAVEDMMLFERGWCLFLLVQVAGTNYVLYWVGKHYGLAALLGADALLAAVVPASLAVLAITRSPLQSLNPVVIGGVIGRCGSSYWVLPTFFLGSAFIIAWLSAGSTRSLLVEALSFYLTVVFFGLIGAVVRPHQFHEDVDIYDPVEPGEQALNEDLLKERTGVLGHAYGFISRDNRAGGLKHIYSWLEQDPAPHNAWDWFFKQMMNWEIKEPALVFAQSYLTRLLHDGDYDEAVKVLLKCRLVHETFLPLAADRELARAAAEHCNNDELVRVL